MKTAHRSRGSNRLAAVSSTRSLRDNNGRFTDRRTTRNWWRSTAFSTSNAATAERPTTSRVKRRTTRFSTKNNTTRCYGTTRPRAPTRTIIPESGFSTPSGFPDRSVTALQLRQAVGDRLRGRIKVAIE
jgi:transglutaminase-like putative cysteine protease